ncbi:MULTISPECIES: putrescine-ornithine antiporter [Pseudomonas]|uniref:putrescine-ornithine antiporter n=1 Tax=Pseudomonas TaxID=286 RepID=UPI0004D724E3|nr:MULTISPECIES: putrescine-ornithine antiporter [Pseudomonas]AMO76748.1 Putrescine-ornithine antiporter [Pseudomonas citronellolis]KES22224.1 putrescine transporter [Pseudomonas sp. AAC]KRV69880.1 putrescine-ornithine antiporter [Pseudomonas citronellolis]KRW77862.1 putrescine-ornithine antiporter [Pseudomonas citronellolis]MBH3432099.1 putrescine-ornithine antiporter [Pseudomonas citronellolis]
MATTRKMGLTGLTTLVMVNMMGSGIIMLPSSMAQLGAVSLLSWVFTAVGSMAIAYCFAQCGIYCPRSGGMSAYSEEAHGKSAFFLCSYLYFLSLVISNVAISLSAVGYLTPFFPWLGSGSVPLLLGTLGLIWLTTLANFGGPRITGRLGSVTVWGVIIPVAGLGFFGWFWFRPEVFAAAWNPNDLPVGQAITDSIPLTLWAFLGMESAAQNSDAVDNPKRNVPLACLLGTLGAAVVYVLSTTVIQGLVPNPELANSSAPFALAYARLFNDGVGNLVMALAVMACVGSLLGWQFTLAETAKVTAAQGLFPQLFTRVTNAGAPLAGLVTCAVLQSLIALSTISPNATAQFNKLVNLAAVTNIIPYITSLTGLVVILYKAGVGLELVRRNTAVMLVAACYCFYALYASGLEAVFGAALVMVVGYLLFGFIAKRFVKAYERLAAPPESP